MPDQDPNDQPQDAPEAAGADAPETGAAEEQPADSVDFAEEALAAANEALSAFDPDADEAADPGAAMMEELAGEAGIDAEINNDTPIGDDGIAEEAGGFAPADFDTVGVPRELPDGLDLLADVNLNVKIELGRTRMFVEDVLRLNSGSVVELDKLAGDPVDIYVNDRPVARGEVLVLNDNFCVRISEIIARVEDDAAGDGAAA